jgi:RNA polymerase sigma factor (sigma-70 family)
MDPDPTPAPTTEGQFSNAEQYLLDGVRRRDAEAWSQLVSRYEGRLVAFARGKAIKGADAEDLVQDTFVQFLRGLDRFRGEASLETYLFLILRRRIVEWFRGKHVRSCTISDPDAAPEGAVGARGVSADASASWYVRREERRDIAREALSSALRAFVGRMREEKNFRDLQIIEMLFYAQLRNTQVARDLGLDEKYVALLKHRWIKQLRGQVGAAASGEMDAQDLSAESMLSEIWEEQRPSCPKRSTLGGYLLGTLDSDWQGYVAFHVNRLGCRFCLANLEDLRRQTAEEPRVVRERVMQSTVGFFAGK